MKTSFIFCLVVILTACGKGSVDKDSDAPALTLNTPANNQTYSGGQSIQITGVATDNKFIKEIHVVITDLVAGTEYQHVHIHPNASTFGFSHSYTAQAGVSYKIQVIADDNAENSTAKSVQVSCN